MGDTRLLDRDEYLRRLVDALAAKTFQLNAAVGLLRRIRKGNELEEDWDALDVRDFLSAFPAAEGEPK